MKQAWTPGPLNPCKVHLQEAEWKIDGSTGWLVWANSRHEGMENPEREPRISKVLPLTLKVSIESSVPEVNMTDKILEHSVG
jgi:hypothetical protein